jgi:hypothetical protein
MICKNYKIRSFEIESEKENAFSLTINILLSFFIIAYHNLFGEALIRDRYVKHKDLSCDRFDLERCFTPSLEILFVGLSINILHF